MAKVAVYKVQVYDIMSDGYVISRRMATREGAATMKGKVIENSKVEIDENQLESGEKWTAIDFKP